MTEIKETHKHNVSTMQNCCMLNLVVHKVTATLHKVNEDDLPLSE